MESQELKYTEEKYIQERVDDQINWYGRKSQINQKWYKLLRLMEITAAASIPLVAGYMGDGGVLWAKITAGTFGLVVAIITAIIGLYNFQERWVEYRRTCESLKHEKYLYLTKTEPYNNKDASSLFFKRIEFILSTENTKWSKYLISKKTDHHYI